MHSKQGFVGSTIKMTTNEISDQFNNIKYIILDI